jgi:hypothetical protein
MQQTGLRRLGALGAAAICAGAIGATAVGASASDADRQDGVATITMELEGKRAFFAGAKSVESGSDLAIVNNTDPREIGPHTFTLVEKSELPKGEQEMKDCFKFKSEFCLKIVKHHKVNLKTGEIGKPDIDVGKKGWDASYGKKGDSWATAEEGEETDRVVSAKPGSKLFYFCLVHPDMQGKVKVK